MAIEIKSIGQASIETLHQMGCESVEDGLLAQGYIDSVLAAPLEQSNRFEEAQLVRDLAAKTYSEQQHTALMIIDSVARLELAQDKAISRFYGTLLTLKGETNTDTVLRVLVTAFYKLAHELKEANAMLQFQPA